MTKVKVELECLKDLLKREPIVKVVNELPDKATADLNYIYVVPKEGEGKDTKAYVLRPDRSGYDAIDLTPQLVNVVGEGYITVEKETRNENGDVTFTVSTSPSLKALLDSLSAKDNELEAKVTSLEAKDSEQDAKLDALKAHDEQVDDALEAVGQNIEKTVDLIDNKVQALNKVNESQNKDITELQKDSQGLKELTSELDNSVNELNDQLKTLDGKIDEEVKAVHTEVKQGIKANESAIKGVEDDLTAFRTYTDSRLEALENKEDKDTVYDDTELKGRVKALEDKPEPTPYNDKPISDRVTALESKTDNFVSNVGVSREGNTVKLTYTMVNGDNKEVEFTDNDTVSMAYDDSALKSRVEALEKKPDKDTVYNDSDLKDQVNDLGSSMASALHDISEIRVNNESRLSALEKKPDNDKQTLSLEGNTLSISNGNSVELPKAKPVKVSSTSEGVTVTPEEEDGTTNYKVNIDDALSKYYDKSKTYTKQEVDSLIVKQEEKATDIKVYRGTFPNRDKVKEGSVDIPKSPRATLTYSSSTGVGIARVDFTIVSDVAQNTPIVELPADAPTPAELIEAQAWVGDVFTSIWIGKSERVIRMVNTNDPRIFNKRIILNIPGIFKK